jgi:hypothetical protein
VLPRKRRTNVIENKNTDRQAKAGKCNRKEVFAKIRKNKNVMGLRKSAKKKCEWQRKRLPAVYLTGGLEASDQGEQEAKTMVSMCGADTTLC